MCHVTGGGIIENLPRVIPEHCSALIEKKSWKWPPLFEWISSSGNISELEMYRTFNCGVGMIVCIEPADLERTLKILNKHQLEAWKIGEIGQGPNEVCFVS